MRYATIWVRTLSLVISLSLGLLGSALAADAPRQGGILRIALAADPPTLDMHQEQTFAVAQPMGPIYNLLIDFDPHNYPEIIGDLAKSWTVSEDDLTYTFTLYEGVTFHDGSPLTSADVKASWYRIIAPTGGVISPRRSNYQMVKSIEAPDDMTVVFHLHYPSPSFLSGLAHPANFIYAKKYLDEDVHYYKNHAIGTGPFKLKSYVRGSQIELERNPNYWKPGFPYLDGVKYFIMKDTSARAKAIRSGRVDAELRYLPGAEADAIKAQMGDKVVVAKPRSLNTHGVTINVAKKPFDDERVRKALTLALDRRTMAKMLGPVALLDTVGGMMHPDSQWALPPEELSQMPGFGSDYEANIKEAQRLLAEAGYPNGFKTVLTNRNIKTPYIDFAVSLIASWKRIGVEAQHKMEETATWSQSRVARNFELIVDPYGSATVGDPDEMLDKFTTTGSENWGRFSDPVLDDLYKQQAREMDEQKRIELVRAMDKRILEKVWRIQGLWYTRIEVRSAQIRNYEPQPSHWMNRRFEDVWLAQ
jgi:peptide/nickel transport system substrate-binding protein